MSTISSEDIKLSNNLLVHLNEKTDLTEENSMDVDRDNEEDPQDHLYDDLLKAIYGARFFAPLFAIIIFFISYHIIISPYKKKEVTKFLSKDEVPLDWNSLKYIRPVLTENEISRIQHITQIAETEFWLPLPSYDIVKLHYHSHASKHGTISPPELFYSGVTFGLSTENSHSLEYTSVSADTRTVQQLQRDLEQLVPRPTHIMRRSAALSVPDWSEAGLAVHWSYDDLARQDMLGADRREPWRRVLPLLLDIARAHRQVYLTVWYPNIFGNSTNSTNSTSDKDNRFRHILQQVIPCRTGMAGIASIRPVWLSEVNGSDPHKHSGSPYRSPHSSDPPVQRSWVVGDEEWRRLLQATQQHRPADTHSEIASPSDGATHRLDEEL